MNHGLRSKLTFSYAVMAILLIAIISFCVNFIFQNQFKNYVIRQQKQNSQNIVALVEKQYDTSTGEWNAGAIENIGMNALSQGIILKVKDRKGGIVWDATIHNNGLCVQMLSQMAKNMRSRNPNFKGGYKQENYALKANFKQIGEADIGYYGPYYYTSDDVRFLNQVNTALAAVGIASLLLALLLGSLMSGRISRPISKAVRAASEIARGDYTQRITDKSGTREIDNLSETVNRLAGSLEQQEALRKRMAADVAHELRTPLASLQSSLEAMIDGIWNPSKERLESCHEEILRINRLVGDLEALERAEADNTVLDRSEFDLAYLARQAINNFEPDFHKKNIALHFEGDRAHIRADRDKITQVIVNLLSNALKYTPADGKVSVTVRQTEQWAELTVADNGSGIPEEDLPYIFERFYRADKSRNRLTGGSGLGLAITKAIVQAHGGEIKVSSRPEQGTAFTVILPKA